jgi:8-amino-7-oxononanoate synthase
VCAVATDWGVSLAEALEERREQGLLRDVRAFRGVGPKLTSPAGRKLLNLSSNDYLGLAGHPALAEAAARAARERGTGSTASRLIVGGDPALDALEERLAAHKGTEATLVLGSGFLANAGVIPALVGRGDAVFSDRLNHASIIDGCRLSRAEVYPYRHGDAEHLDSLLAASRAARKLIVTETVFSMDGDVAPLEEIVELKERHGAALMVDEAHGAGIFGPHGEGFAHEADVANAVDLHMGTFSKAFGVYGAYVAGPATWVSYLENSCRSFVYSTALPPPVVGAVDAALTLVRDADAARVALHAKAGRFRTRLAELGFDTGGSTTQIVPVVVGDTERVVELSRRLEDRGVLAVAIRPPTVPDGTARLRLSLMATHSDEDLADALDAIAEVGEESAV